METRAASPDFAFTLAYRPRRSFFTKSERLLFTALEQAVSARYAIMAKVRLLDLCEGLDKRYDTAALNRVSAKHVDFLLLERATMRPWRAIELDDRTHLRPDRIARDVVVNAFFRKIGLPLIRLHPQLSYEPVSLRHAIETATIKPPRSSISA